MKQIQTAIYMQQRNNKELCECFRLLPSSAALPLALSLSIPLFFSTMLRIQLLWLLVVCLLLPSPPSHFLTLSSVARLSVPACMKTAGLPVFCATKYSFHSVIHAHTRTHSPIHTNTLTVSLAQTASIQRFLCFIAYRRKGELMQLDTISLPDIV